MKVEDHKRRHAELHRAVDELIADYLCHNRKKRLGNTTVLELVQWSAGQMEDPTPTTHKSTAS